MDTRFWWAIREKAHVGWMFYASAESHGRLFEKDYIYSGPYGSLEEAKKAVKERKEVE
jgi:hypothetical protein